MAHSGRNHQAARRCLALRLPRWQPIFLLAAVLLVFFSTASSQEHTQNPPVVKEEAAAADVIDPNLDEVLRKLATTAALTDGLDLLQLADAQAAEFLTQPLERSYAFVLLFNSLDPQCGPCRYVGDLMRMMKWAYDDALARNKALRRTPVFFAQLLPHEAPEAFGKLGVTSVPSVVFVPSGPLWSLEQHMVVATNAEMVKPDALASWLSRMTSERIRAPKPHWMAENVVSLVIIGSCLLFFLYHWRELVIIFQFRMFWFVVALGVYGFTMSGMHWNILRGAPLVAVTRSGQIMLFRGGYSQTALEGLIMAAIFIGGGMTFVGITRLTRERVKAVLVLRFCFLAILWTVLFCWTILVFGFVKNRGYAPLSGALSGYDL